MPSNVHPHLYQNLNREEQQVSPHSEEHLPLVGAGDQPSLTQLRRPPLSHTTESIHTQMLYSEQPSLRGTDTDLLLEEKWDSPQRSVASPMMGTPRCWHSALLFLACWINRRTTDKSVQWGPTGT